MKEISKDSNVFALGVITKKRACTLRQDCLKPTVAFVNLCLDFSLNSCPMADISKKVSRKSLCLQFILYLTHFVFSKN